MAEYSAATALPGQSTPCPRGTLVGLIPGAQLLIPAGCHRWQCPNCGWKNAKRLASRIVRTPCRRFLTLTVRFDPAADPIAQLDELNRAWRLLWKRIKRRHKEKARGYVKVVELTQQGAPHFHIAIDAPFISQRWLSAQWRELTGSPVVDIRLIRTERGLARYLAKYLTKASETVASRRKFSASRGFLPPYEKPPPEPGEIEPGWSHTRDDTDRLRESLRAQGWHEMGKWWLDPDTAALVASGSP